MTDIDTVLSWLEGLTHDDWRAYHSDSEVQNIAAAAMELIKHKVMSTNDFAIEESENEQEE